MLFINRILHQDNSMNVTFLTLCYVKPYRKNIYIYIKDFAK